MTQLEISASDSIIRMVVCEDSNGVQGIAFNTALGQRLECGMLSQRCTPYSSRGVYPLGGFAGSCEAAGGRGRQRERRTVVTRVFGACWNTQAPTRAPGAQMQLVASGLELFMWLFACMPVQVADSRDGVCLPPVLFETKAAPPVADQSVAHQQICCCQPFQALLTAALFGLSAQRPAPTTPSVLAMLCCAVLC
jgi:hypothetical protein